MTRSRDEEIRGAYVGKHKPTAGPIVLVDYDSSWPAQFEDEAGGIRRALGDRALRIEHAGSTSVPGLPAKPVLDMILAVADSADEASYVPAMEDAGYELRIREPDWFEHRLFRGPKRTINLHVFSEGCGEIERMLAFRDHLRRDAVDRELYAAKKRELAKRKWKYVQHYADAKTEIVKEILRRAGLAR